MGPGCVYCLDCRRAVPMEHSGLINTIPTRCPWCEARAKEAGKPTVPLMRYGFERPGGAYEPSEDDKETFRCAGMVWTD